MTMIPMPTHRDKHVFEIGYEEGEEDRTMPDGDKGLLLLMGFYLVCFAVIAISFMVGQGYF